jgi:outer membrane protein assembly factor BamB
MPVHLKPLVIVLASLLLPPAGLLLLWMRTGWSVLKRALLSVPILALGIAHLFLFYGLGIEMYGSGTPHLRFGRAESHDRAVEDSRAAQTLTMPAPAGLPPTLPADPAVAPAVAPPDAPADAPPGPAPEHRPVAAAAPELSKPAGSTYWADFRGPERLGHYDQMPILTTWPANGLRRLWKQPGGGGYASFSVAHGVAFTIEQRRDKEVVAAYDLGTGREHWTSTWAARFSESMGGDGPRATPVWNGGRVFALGATGELRCLDAASGQTIWRKNILDDNGATNLQWGMAASPLIAGNAVIVQPGGPGGRSVVAYDTRTGERLWSALDDKAAYTSAVQVTVAGQAQLLTITATRAVGLSSVDGALLWEFPWVTQYGVNAVEPIVIPPNHVFLSSGYGKGSALVELSPRGDGFQATEVWSNKRLETRFNGPVLYQGHVYGLDEGILTCVDIATGEQKWKGGRYGYGQLLLASGHLVILTEEGEVVLVRATPEKLDERARFTAITGKTWNYPAISDGVLLVRNEEEMAAFEIGEK